MKTLAAIADAVYEALKTIPDNVDKGEEICMGADGTPTSQVDKIAENTVLDFIQRNEVPLNVLSEEIGFVDNGFIETLVLDPVDGTRNCSLGIPYYSISMAVCEKSMNDARCALIRNLATGDEFTAIKGKGAFLNGRKISVKNEFDPKKSMFFMYVGKSSGKTPLEIASRSKSSRSMGCSSLEMSGVAEGSADGFIMLSEDGAHSIRVVDIAASCLILREAGGEIYTKSGKILDMPLDVGFRSDFIATSCKECFQWIVGEKSTKKIKFGLFANVGIPDVVELAQRTLSALEGEECEIDSGLAKLLGVNGTPLSKMSADMLIVIGGDGTILKATHETDAAIFAINAGGVGFLSSVEKDDLENGIHRLKEGDYTIDSRSRIRVSLDGVYVGDAVNEALIHTDTVAKIRRFKVTVDGSFVTEVKSDGFALSTVTGSTSYAMSLGAPIMDPRVDSAWILVPIAAFRYSSRPIILPTSAEVVIDATMQDKGCLLVLDGQKEIPVRGGGRIGMKISPRCLKLVDMGTDFYQRVRDKLVTSL